MSENLIYIEIGYDSHLSTYSITTSQADQVLSLTNKDEINEYIITRGEFLSLTNKDVINDRLVVFFNYVDGEVEELHLQLREANN